MGIFDDILKGLPVNPVLREQVSQLNAQKAAAETENAILKDDLRKAHAKINDLEKQIEKLTHKPDLNEIEIQIITLLAKHIQVSEMEIPVSLGVIPATARHHLEQLRERHYVTKKSGMPCDSYALTKDGRAFASENHLIEYPAAADVS